MNKQFSFTKMLTYVCMTAVSVSLLFSPIAPLKQAAADSVRGLTNVTSPMFKVGDKVTLQMNAAYFPTPLTKSSNPRNFQVEYYGKKGESFKVDFVDGEMVGVKDDSRGTLWIPSWYLAKDSVNTKSIPPMTVIMKSKRSLSMRPGSNLKWSEMKSNTSYTAVAQWKDWYGVLVSPAQWQQDYTIYRPALLWVQAKDIESKKTLPEGLWNKNSDISSGTILELVTYMLKDGDDSTSILKLLGTPQVKEKSVNLQMEDRGPMQLGETWRYERDDAQFIVTFSKSGKLKQTEWIMPSIDTYRDRRSSGDDYYFTYDFVTSPLARTLKADQVWRNQGDLNFSYLIGGNDDALLLKGDDGGFSGFHHNSSLYALNRKTGKKLWQQNAGFGGFTAKMDSENEYVTMYSAYNPDIKDYEDRVRHIRLEDGKIVWEVKLKKSGGAYGMTAADRSIIVYELWGPNSKTETLTVLDSKTGNVRWKKTLSEEYRILSQGVDDPYVLIQQNQQLKAYNTITGKAVWSLNVKGTQLDDPARNPYYTGGERIEPLAPADSTTRWVLLGEEWLLLNTKTGKSEAVYPANPDELFEVLDQRYLLVQRGSKHHIKGIESVFYDAVEKRELWTFKGSATKGVIEGDTIYLALNGVPAAVHKKTGEVQWKMRMTSTNNKDLSHLVYSSFAVLDRYLLIQHASNLLVLNKEDGSLLGRLHDVHTGSAELREQEARNGALNATNEDVYVGTANGAFVRYDAKALEQMLDQEN
ncbi:PQQ-like domain-containing protein [Paenibacillus uliginis N3/975]|uniref:PQQ-like domain-containing protein n=1 Tax=Paenibacillus uliginis N3/975 TaxID=1313296 RepID=A0A1X7HNC1_9BACL|nr:PQQ-binding-like beta-propeller repeat protein [Paenibacillus uliginis]SMF89835.1 PQQ-like domain-containing protein [Paenibacillus uliginis N3/975]